MIRILLTAALLAVAPMASAVAIIVARPAVIVARPVTVAPVSRPTVTTPHVSGPAPVTRAVTPAVTPVPLFIPAHTTIRADDSCANERKLRGDCYTM
jgi:hypothetical protein